LGINTVSFGFANKPLLYIPILKLLKESAYCLKGIEEIDRREIKAVTRLKSTSEKRIDCFIAVVKMKS
jgi:hypothetical protein